MNPILANLNRTNGMIQNIINLKRCGSDPNAIMLQLINNNPQFRTFVESNKGKTPEQIATENGIDLNQVMSLLK